MNQHLGKNYCSFFLKDIVKYKELSEVIMVTHESSNKSSPQRVKYAKQLYTPAKEINHNCSEALKPYYPVLA